jgi:hypothetical protein
MIAKPWKIPHPYRKLKKELIDVICHDISEGAAVKHACLANGITHRIFDMWAEQGDCDLEHGLEDTLPAYLVLSLNRIKMNEVKMCRRAILNSDKGHKGAEWTLEHAYWRHYGSSAPVLEMADEIAKLKAEMRGNAQDETESTNKAETESEPT